MVSDWKNWGSCRKKSFGHLSDVCNIFQIWNQLKKVLTEPGHCFNWAQKKACSKKLWHIGIQIPTRITNKHRRCLDLFSKVPVGLCKCFLLTPLPLSRIHETKAGFGSIGAFWYQGNVDSLFRDRVGLEPEQSGIKAVEIHFFSADGLKNLT